MQGLIRGQALLRSPVARLLGARMAAPAVGRFTSGGGRSGHTRVVAEYRKGGKESEEIDGQVTRLWKYFFRPGVGTTDRLGFAIPIGDKLDQRTEDERFEARQQAARNAVNIDDQERRRRIIFGGALLVVTGVLVWYLVDKHAGPFERLGVLPVFFLGAAEMASGVSGL